MEATMARAKKPPAERRRILISLDRETHLALLRRALDETEATGERVSATQIVERLIEQYLSRKGSRT
jgi:hypothetical protein